MKLSWTMRSLFCALVFSACATKPIPPASQAAEPASWPDKLDAVIAALDNHRILLENDRVRVLEVTIAPHAKEPVHAHRWPSVLYIDQAGEFVDYDDQGKVLFDSRTAKEPIKYPVTQWLEATPPHAVENLSDKPVHLIRVEMKR